MSSQDTLALGSALLLIVSSVVSYIFGRRGAFNAGFDAGWKTCEEFMVKEILKGNAEITSLRSE
jgi:hypothetical protein